MTKELFFDTDCLSSFLWIGDTSIIEALYGGRIILPEPVYDELGHPAIQRFGIKERADKLIDDGVASVQTIEVGTQEYGIYRELTEHKAGKKAIGKGEASGIALAKTYNGVLVSNNTRDIMPYVEEYGLKRLDTGQILMEALEKGLITEKDGNDIWQKMLARKRWLPAKSFSEYKRKHEEK